ncbi:MAG: succinylglutamate desuccinylase/aspartoacylase family protein [Planctomycetaceae bacterium]|nr:succinylglutamate desuccinylase/aspartoacylase family protein [Planctomycetaceae bacterium]
MSQTQIHSTVDFTKPGKQWGYLAVPFSYNLGGWAQIRLPVVVIARGKGPTALVMAGNHGDEYPGQVAIMRLMRELQPEQINGRIILVPALNMPAAKAATRLSPIDGRNLNRSFPGCADGTVTEMIADYLTTVLFPQADIVIDMHTGGRSVDFYPCAHMHLVPDKNQRRQMLEGTEAWNSDYCFLYADIAGTGLLPVEAESQGKIVITTEMGGGETVPAAVHRITQSGVRNVLVHFGIVQGEKQTRDSLGLPPSRWVQALDRDDYQFAPESGIYETLVTLGDPVSAGQPVGQIHFLERPDREPVVVAAPSAGVLIASRAPSLVAQGDCVACIAHEVDPRQLP